MEILRFRWMQFWGTYRGFATAGPLTGQLKEAFYYPRKPSESAPSRSAPVLDYAELGSSSGTPARRLQEDSRR
jgi:hypothetical protein